MNNGPPHFFLIKKYGRPKRGIATMMPSKIKLLQCQTKVFLAQISMRKFHGFHNQFEGLMALVLVN